MSDSPRRSLTRRTKLLMSTLAISAVAAVAGLGTFGTFTSTTTAQTPTDASGTVTLDFTGSTTNRLSVGATNLAAGDTLQRGFTVHNGGTLDMAGITMAITASPTSLLDSGTNGLSVKLDSCSTGWTEAGNGTTTPYTYTCSGTTTNIVADTPVKTVIAAGTSGVSLTGVTALTSGTSDSMRATFTLPTAADNTYQNLSSTLSITFTGTQRNAVSK
jgi:spore coat-associated protein N